MLRIEDNRQAVNSEQLAYSAFFLQRPLLEFLFSRDSDHGLHFIPTRHCR